MAMNHDTLPVLNRILARESRTLLQYLSDAWPWASAGERDTLAELRRLIAEEREATQRVGDLLVRRRGVPAVGAYPEGFSETHYLAMDHLLPRLVAYQRWALKELEHDLTQLAGDDEAAAVARQLFDVKRRHLETLETLAARHAGPKAASTRK
jgi:hypothetical protein